MCRRLAVKSGLLAGMTLFTLLVGGVYVFLLRSAPSDSALTNALLHV